MRTKQGFTLVELLIATTVILLTSVGILFTYIQCLELNSINHETSVILQKTSNVMEEVLASPPATVHEAYNEKIFPLENPTGITLVKINDQDPQLLIVTVKTFWKQSKGRIIGEDINLNGFLEQTEDINKNGELDTPTTLVSYIYNR